MRDQRPSTVPEGAKQGAIPKPWEHRLPDDPVLPAAPSHPAKTLKKRERPCKAQPENRTLPPNQSTSSNGDQSSVDGTDRDRTAVTGSHLVTDTVGRSPDI